MAEPAEKPTRRWFQFHLSTRILTALCLAMLVRLNVVYSGYPFPCYAPYFVGGPQFAEYGWDYLPLVGDLVIGVAVLSIIGGISEFWRRTGLRIHLSTAIVMMFVAGLVLWMNVTKRAIYSGSSYFPDIIFWGWPFPYVAQWTEIHPDEPNGILGYNLLTDVSVAILILAAVAFVCELITGRKKHG